MNFIKRHWPVFLVLTVFYLVSGICFFQSCAKTGGHFIYPLDDPYISMAMAKNLAHYGVFGVTRDGFSSSSSSIIWPLVLAAAYFIFGTWTLIPLIGTTCIATLFFIWLYTVLRKASFSQWVTAAVLISILFTVPVIACVFTGLEHMLHIFASVACVYYTLEILFNTENRTKNTRILYGAAAILTSARYEGVFLLSVICFVLVVRRQIRVAVLTGLCGALPVVIFGIVSQAHGWYFFPNSILIKGNLPDLRNFTAFLTFFGNNFMKFIEQMNLTRLMFASVVLAGYHAVTKRTFWTRSMVSSIFFVVTLYIHMQFATFGSVFRYDAYLFALAIFSLWLCVLELCADIDVHVIAKQVLQLKITTAILLVLILPMNQRSFSFILLASASKNIYDQQYQMASFLKLYYPRAKVALNDIGIVNYLADIHCIDLWGLANMHITHARLNNLFSPDIINRITLRTDTQIAILYPTWFQWAGGLPGNWKKVGQWRIQNNLVCGDSTVCFYAVNPAEKSKLRAALIEYSAKLPKDVIYLVQE